MTAEEIKALRLRIGISQEAMADRLGVSQSALARWERGNRKPGRWALAHLQQVCARNPAKE